ALASTRESRRQSIRGGYAPCAGGVQVPRHAEQHGNETAPTVRSFYGAAIGGPPMDKTAHPWRPCASPCLDAATTDGMVAPPRVVLGSKRPSSGRAAAQEGAPDDAAGACRLRPKRAPSRRTADVGQHPQEPSPLRLRHELYDLCPHGIDVVG